MVVQHARTRRRIESGLHKNLKDGMDKDEPAGNHLKTIHPIEGAMGLIIKDGLLPEQKSKME